MINKEFMMRCLSHIMYSAKSGKHKNYMDIIMLTDLKYNFSLKRNKGRKTIKNFRLYN